MKIRITASEEELQIFGIPRDVAQRISGTVRSAKRVNGILMTQSKYEPISGWCLTSEQYVILESTRPAPVDFVLLPHRGLPTPHIASHCR